MKRALPWLAAIFFLGCLGIGILAFRQRAEISSAASTQNEAQSRISDLQRQVGALNAAKAKAVDQIAQLAQRSASLQKSAGDRGNGGPQIVHITDIIKDHPEYMSLYEKQIRHNMERMYGNGLSTLNLAPDQLSQLKKLLTERQMGAIDAEQAATAAGLEPGTPAWHTALQQASQDTENQISSILGSNADNILAQLQARTNIENQVQNNYAPDFADAGMPLTPEQTNGLIQAMADANYAGKDLSTRPANYNVADPTSMLSPHDDRIINNATASLTPQQLQLLTADQAENEQIAAIMRQYTGVGKQVVFVP